MAATTLATYDLDNMVTTAIDTMSTDPVNMLTDSGEKFLKTAAQRGRLFVVNDAENVRHTLLHSGGNDTTLYSPDDLDGDPAINDLSASATEVLTQNLFTLYAGSKNINFPQSQPAGNVMDYVATVVKANMMEILNHEELLFTRGALAGTADNEAAVAPFYGDEDKVVGKPMSLAGLFLSGSGKGGRATSEVFSGVKATEVAKYVPYFHDATAGSGAAAKGDNIVADLQVAMLNSSYSDSERPTHVMTNITVFEKVLKDMRALGAFPDPVNGNLGKEGTITFAGMTIDWSRYLDFATIWDITASPDADEHPVLGINWNSLRLNVTRAGGINDNSIGFINQIGSLQPHPTLTNVFKRLEWKRCWSVDNGRRSFFKISGLTDADLV